jgi:Fatty acid desaturase
VTETFESHHITEKASLVLKKFYVREASQPRNYKFLYPEDGFYRTLKRRVADKIKENPKAFGADRWKSKLIADVNLIALFVASILAARVESTMAKFLLTLFAGQFLAWCANFAHNFMHQKDNWRMFAANIPLINYKDYRVFHVMSHHMFPNSHTDLETTGFENSAQKWIPYSNKSKLQAYWGALVSPVAYCFVFSWNALLR